MDEVQTEYALKAGALPVMVTVPQLPVPLGGVQVSFKVETPEELRELVGACGGIGRFKRGAQASMLMLYEGDVIVFVHLGEDLKAPEPEPTAVAELWAEHDRVRAEAAALAEG